MVDHSDVTRLAAKADLLQIEHLPRSRVMVRLLEFGLDPRLPQKTIDLVDQTRVCGMRHATDRASDWQDLAEEAIETASARDIVSHSDTAHLDYLVGLRLIKRAVSGFVTQQKRAGRSVVSTDVAPEPAQAQVAPPPRTRIKFENMLMPAEAKGRGLHGWRVSGSYPDAYEGMMDRTGGPGGSAACLLRSRDVFAIGVWACLRYRSPANMYRGRRLRLTAAVKCVDVGLWTGLWMRVDASPKKTLSFDNMSGRPITGTVDWHHYQITLDVPEDSADISFGVLLHGAGEVWLNDVGLEVVDTDVPTTDIRTLRLAARGF